MSAVPFLVIAGGLLLKMRERVVKDDDTTQDDTTPTTPNPSETKWTETSEWSGEYIAGENVVWSFRTGIRYQDGRTEWDSTTFYVIGNGSHTSFLSANSDSGTIDIKWEYTGNPDKQDSKNVVVFPTLEDAQKRADELANPDDEDDPTSPQKPPEDDETPSQPSLPQRPDFGFGGMTNLGGGF
jgi:hypothetical protein